MNDANNYQQNSIEKLTV